MPSGFLIESHPNLIASIRHRNDLATSKPLAVRGGLPSHVNHRQDNLVASLLNYTIIQGAGNFLAVIQIGHESDRTVANNVSRDIWDPIHSAAESSNLLPYFQHKLLQKSLPLLCTSLCFREQSNRMNINAVFGAHRKTGYIFNLGPRYANRIIFHKITIPAPSQTGGRVCSVISHAGVLTGRALILRIRVIRFTNVQRDYCVSKPYEDC